MDTIEENYVKKFYDSTAKEFSNTRYRPWTCVEKFMGYVEEGSIVADILITSPEIFISLK